MSEHKRRICHERVVSMTDQDYTTLLSAIRAKNPLADAHIANLERELLRAWQALAADLSWWKQVSAVEWSTKDAFEYCYTRFVVKRDENGAWRWFRFYDDEWDGEKQISSIHNDSDEYPETSGGFPFWQYAAIDCESRERLEGGKHSLF